VKVEYKEPYVIAEIGGNHQGNIELAKEMIKQARMAGASCVKFQKRDNKFWLNKNPKWNEPHPNPINSFGETYYEHRKNVELDIIQHKELKEYCDLLDIDYSCSCWDVNSARELISLNLEFIKVPSACNLDFDMLKVLRNEYEGEVHLSVGMTTKDEIDKIIKFFNDPKRLVIYSCTSGYPVPAKDVALLEITKLKNKYKEFTIGFSGHHNGIALDIAAYTLGANIIERHFTYNKFAKGTDHSASLDFNELKEMCHNLKETYLALQNKKEDILDIEKVQREKLKS